MQKSLCANGGTQTLIVSEACFPGADWLKALDDGQLCRLDRQIGVQAFLQHIPIGAVPRTANADGEVVAILSAIVRKPFSDECGDVVDHFAH